MFHIVLAAGLATRLVLPAFSVTLGPGLIGNRLPDAYAGAFTAARCVTPLPASHFGAQSAKAMEECEGNLVCIAEVARLMGAPYLLLGSVTKLDTEFTTRLQLVDVEAHAVKQTFEGHYSGNLKGFNGSLDTLVPQVCHAIDPAWVDPAKKAAEDKLAQLDFDSGDARSPKTAKPAPGEFDLPPLPPDEPATKTTPPPTVTRPAPVAVAPKPAAKPAPATVVLRPKESPAMSFFMAPRSPRARLGTYISLGAVGASAVVAGVFGASALSAVNQRSAATSQGDFYAAQSAIESRGTGANIALGVASTALVTSIVMWFAGDRFFHAE